VQLRRIDPEGRLRPFEQQLRRDYRAIAAGIRRDRKRKIDPDGV
jgi:hypothetical protein